MLESLKESQKVELWTKDMRLSPCSLRTPLTVHIPDMWVGLVFGIRICLLKSYPEGLSLFTLVFFTVKDLRRAFKMQIE